MTGGVSLGHTEFPNGTDSNIWNASLGLWWRPQAGREAYAFFSRHATTHDQIGPVFNSAGASLPPFGPRRQFDGPDWAAYRGVGLNRGVMLSEQLAPDWQLRLGLFHSEFDDARGVSNLFLDLQPDGQGRRLLIIDPRARTASDSGELRLSHRFGAQDWAQRVHLQLAGRARQRQSGGSATLDLGPRRLGEAIELAEPSFAFGPEALDRVHQNWLGLAYELRRGSSLEFSAGAQKTHYRKDFARPGQARVQDRAAPWLYNLGGAWHFSPSLAAYAGWTRGLEESGVAPGHASNRNQALPAIQTRQHDAGLRWQINPRMKLVAGVFEVRKPYLNLDAANLFTQLGAVRHRGAEISLSGHPIPELRLLAGAVLMQPRVLGEGVASGTRGRAPGGPARAHAQAQRRVDAPGLGRCEPGCRAVAPERDGRHARQPRGAARQHRTGPGPAPAFQRRPLADECAPVRHQCGRPPQLRAARQRQLFRAPGAAGEPEPEQFVVKPGSVV